MFLKKGKISFGSVNCRLIVFMVFGALIVGCGDEKKQPPAAQQLAVKPLAQQPNTVVPIQSAGGVKVASKPETGLPGFPAPRVVPAAPYDSKLAALSAPGTAVAAASETATPSGPTVPGVPHLDPKIGLSLDDASKTAANALNKQAMKKYKKKKYGEAIELFILALTKNPGNLLIRYNLACTYVLNGQTDIGLAVLEQFQKTPECPRCFIMLAQATKDKDFKAVKESAVFKSIVAGAADELKAKLKAAKWITFDKASLKNEGCDFKINGLPAISEDGRKIAVAKELKDGGRGAPNMALQIIDPLFNKVVYVMKILTLEEGEKIMMGEADPAEMTQKIESRIKKAHKKMLGPNWTELTVTSGSSNPFASCGVEKQTIRVGNSSVVYEQPVLSILNKNGHSLFKGKVTDWLDTKCNTQSVIETVYTSGVHHTMLFKVEYCESVDCAQPGMKWKSIRLE